MTQRKTLPLLGAALFCGAGIISGIINNATGLITNTTTRHIVGLVSYFLLAVIGIICFVKKNKSEATNESTNETTIYTEQSTQNPRNNRQLVSQKILLLIISVVASASLNLVFSYCIERNAKMDSVLPAETNETDATDTKSDINGQAHRHDIYYELYDYVINHNYFERFSAMPLHFGVYYGESEEVAGQTVPSGDGVYFYNDGHTYVGNWKKGQPHGFGIIYWEYPDSSHILFYRGDWNHGKREGHGYCYYENGDIYEGDWKNSLREGNGEYIYSENSLYYPGAVYKGAYSENVRYGQGHFENYSGALAFYDETMVFHGDYVGSFENDMFEGSGVFTFREETDTGDNTSDTQYYFEGTFHSNHMWIGTLFINNTYTFIEDGMPTQ